MRRPTPSIDWSIVAAWLSIPVLAFIVWGGAYWLGAFLLGLA